MKNLKSLYSATLVLAMSVPASSLAALVTATFDSTVLGDIRVTRVSGTAFPAVSNFDAVELTFTWDDSQVDSIPDATLGAYEYTAPPVGMSVLINGRQYVNSYVQGNFNITVYDNSLSSIWGQIDDVSFSGNIDGDTPNNMLVGFSGAGQEILSSDSLPTLAELQAFPYIAGRFDIYGPGSSTSSTVWFASPRPPTGPLVPIPATLWLLISGIGMIAGIGMRKKSLKQLIGHPP